LHYLKIFLQNNKIPVLYHLPDVTKVIKNSIVIGFISIFKTIGTVKFRSALFLIFKSLKFKEDV